MLCFLQLIEQPSNDRVLCVDLLLQLFDMAFISIRSFEISSMERPVNPNERQLAKPANHSTDSGRLFTTIRGSSMPGGYYSAAELAKFALAALPGRASEIARLADKERWPFVTKIGRGGAAGEIKLYTIPKYVQAAIALKRHREIHAELAQQEQQAQQQAANALVPPPLPTSRRRQRRRWRRR